MIKYVLAILIMIGFLSCKPNHKKTLNQSKVLPKAKVVTDLIVFECSDDYIKSIGINPIIEPNPIHREILTKYLYDVLTTYDEDSFNIFLSKNEDIFSRPSFRKIIFEMFFNDSLKICRRNSEEIYYDMMDCPNKGLQLEVADSLFKKDKFGGLLILWDNFDESKLTGFKKYAESNRNNFYFLKEMACIYHNQNKIQSRDHYFNRLKKLNPKYEKVIKPFFKEKYIDYRDLEDTSLEGTLLINGKEYPYSPTNE